MKILFLCIVAITIYSCTTTTNKVVVAGSKVENTSSKGVDTTMEYEVVHELPKMKNGISEFTSRLILPEEFKNSGIEKGVVLVRALIGTDGKVIKISIAKSLGYGCDEQVISVLNETEFYPGVINGQAVKTWISIPVTFKNQSLEHSSQ